MCFNKKKQAEDTVEELRLAIVNGERKISSLDLTKKLHAEAMIEALDEKKDFAREVNVEAAGAKTVLKKWVAKNYGNFLYLNKKQYFEEVASIYVYGKMKHTAPNATCASRLQIFKSYDEKPVVKFQHKTYEGEELNYFDTDLQIPTKIACTVTIRVKIKDAMLFLNELDVAVPQVTADIIADYFDRKIQSCFRLAFAKYIVTPAVGCYHLPEYIEPIAEELRSSFSVLGDSGIQLQSLDVNNIQIPNNTNELMEEQYYTTMKKDAEFQIEKKEAELALEHYERKAAIHEKYKSFEPTLTEAEKDFALKRYLIKNGKYREERSALKRRRLAEKSVRLNVSEEPTLQRSRPVAPVKENSRKFPAVTFGCFGAAILLSLVLFSAGVVVGLVMLGLSFAVGGIFIGLNWQKLKKDREFNKTLKTKGASVEEDYAAEVAEFERTDLVSEIPESDKEEEDDE